MPGFFDCLGDRIDEVDSLVSVGLDPDPDRLPAFVRDADRPRLAFNRRVVDATHEYAACYKPNAAFYEDPDGWRALSATVDYAHERGVPVLLDAKRGDIGNTARRYARALDEADAVTVNPYMGEDSLRPFLDREGAGVFVLCRTSNPGGADLQNLELADFGHRLYEHVARLAARWHEEATADVGLVVGATAPAELERLRERVPALPFLVPGVGAQGGDVAAAARHGPADGVGLVNSSRGILFAGEGADDAEDYFAAAGEAARRLRDDLNAHR
ncbi:MAG: orotidine-5'-phosphate decarboxylase [Halobacteriaceae archaeon]